MNMRCVTASIAILAGAATLAQTPAAKFESAAIETSQDPDGRSGFFTAPGKVRLENQTLKDCVRVAYGMEVARGSGGPKWIETQKFDIEASAPRGVDEREIKAMLRNLLQERFGLVLRRESKTSAAFALTIAKGGVKIRAVQPGPGHINTRRASLTGEAASMANLAQSLAVLLNTPVVDMTALPGVFDFMLEWRPSTVQPGELTDDDNKDPNVLPDPAPSPTLFRAIEEQLGLKLERRKLPLEILIIDRAERPKSE